MTVAQACCFSLVALSPLPSMDEIGRPYKLVRRRIEPVTPQATEQDLGQILEASRQEFLAASAGLTEAQACTRPEEGRWSVCECVEHVAIVEERFLGFLENGERAGSPVIDPQKEANLIDRVPDRTERVQAPEMVHPSGRFATLADAIAAFSAIRARSIRFAQERASDLSSLGWTHPRFGALNGREVLILMAGHCRRHAAQIREVRAAVEEKAASA
jgi:DinB superfamily